MVRNNQTLMDSITELNGRILGCWCHPERCHGDILIKLFMEKFNIKNDDRNHDDDNHNDEDHDEDKNDDKNQQLSAEKSKEDVSLSCMNVQLNEMANKHSEITKILTNEQHPKSNINLFPPGHEFWKKEGQSSSIIRKILQNNEKKSETCYSKHKPVNTFCNASPVK